MRVGHDLNFRQVIVIVVELEAEQIREIADVGRNPTTEIRVREVKMRQASEGADELRDGLSAEVVV
jgi:hypothetical protein